LADPWSFTMDFKQFNDDLRNLPAKLHGVIDKVNRREAERFQRVAKRNAPRSNDGPHIADTIALTPGDAEKAEYVVGIGDDALIYAAALEYGHVAPDGSWVEGEHFWLPAKKISVRRHRRALRRAVLKGIKEQLGL